MNGVPLIFAAFCVLYSLRQRGQMCYCLEQLERQSL